MLLVKIDKNSNLALDFLCDLCYNINILSSSYRAHIFEQQL